MLAGEAAFHAGWIWLALLLGAAVLATISAWLEQTPGERNLAAGLAIVAAAAAIALGIIGHTNLHRNRLQSESVRHAARNRDRLLAATVAAARQSARVALDRVGNAAAGAAAGLDDLLSNIGIESAIAVTSGDTVVAVAGPQRLGTLTGRGSAELVTTPFARMLVIRAERVQRQAQLVLLLDSLPGLPVAGPSLAGVAGGPDGVGWSWTAPVAGVIDYPTVDSAVRAVAAFMQPVAPPIAVLRDRAAAQVRWVIGLGLLALAIVVLVTTRSAVIRAAAILLPLWSLARSEVGATAFGLTAMRTLVAAAALFLLAINLWRRPIRRGVVGVMAAILLLGTAPPLVLWLAGAVVPHGAALSLPEGFAWEAIIAITTAAFLAVAAAPLRTPDDGAAPAAWGAIAAMTALLFGLIGVVAWMPGRPSWAPWYPWLWAVPVVLQIAVTTPRARLLSIATAASVLAALATWSTSLDRRMSLARADLVRLDATADTAAASALDQLAIRAQRTRPTQLDRLYAEWQASRLAREGVPSYLALWSAAGEQRGVVALDSLSVGWSVIAPLVRLAGTTPERIGMAVGAGHHEILVLPLAPDTIATVTIGPRSRLLAPTTFGLLVGWRSPENAPPYSVDIVSRARDINDTSFHRQHRFVIAERVITSGDVPRVARATVEIAPPAPFIVRAALCLLLDVGLILLAWLALQSVLGEMQTLPAPRLGRSYRRTVAAALLAFFVVPAALLTLTSVLRLGADVARQRSAELAATLRDAVATGGLAQADLLHPRADSLAWIGDSVDAALAVYRRGHLVAAGEPILTELGLLPPVIAPPPALPSGAVTTIPIALPDAQLRVGFTQGAVAGTALVAAIPGGDTGLGAEQINRALLLLLVTLAGGIASLLVAGAIADALGRPIDALRRTAVAIGRHQQPPSAEHLPAEFVPVFGALRQMETDLQEAELELRASRERTAAILATLATGVLGIDARGDVTHVNPRATELIGHDLELGRPLSAQLPEAWQEITAESPHLNVLGERGTSHELQVGQRRFTVTIAELDDGGRVLAIADITEAARAARVLAWGEMARQVAHEIKNPLTPMRLGLQHLKRVRSDRPDQLAELIDGVADRILAEIERLDRIARSFARYGMSPAEVQPLEQVDLRLVADEVASLFALSIERPRIEVQGVASATVPARREELVQVLLNLLDNARQADSTVVRLLIDDHALHVADDGRGIRPDQLGRIFDPSFSTITSGTGLGLAIVRRLVEGWGARITVDSAPGNGATFSIIFPM
ncbi:MAG: ATP-binding protein [Gemmatimonadales bacterium]